MQKIDGQNSQSQFKAEMTRRSNEEHIGYVDFCRWVATFMVVLCHTLTAIGRQYETYSLTQNEANVYMALSRLTNWAVPAFLMMSGLLYLNPSKKTDYDYLLKKPIKRIFLALVIFGIPMCILEALVVNVGRIEQGKLVYDALATWIAGETWDHMWYLYMFMGLLMIVPLIKEFIIRASDWDAVCLIVILFVFTSIIPTLNFMGISIGFYIPITSVYPLYFILGYYLEYRVDFSKIHTQWLLITVSVLGGLLFLRQYLFSAIEVKYADPLQVLYAVSVFCLIKKLNIHCRILTRHQNLCFSIYLLHPFFLNVSYKLLRCSPATCGVYTTPLLFAICFFVLSVVAARLLMLVPFLKKHVL